MLCSLTVGNLHAQHFGDVASRLVESFDDFVVGCVPAAITRAASYGGDDPVATMLAASRGLLLDSGAAADRLVTEADPAEAIRITLTSARPGDLVVLLAKHQHALPVINEFLSNSGQPRTH